MFLRLVAVDQLGQERDFSCQLTQLEVGFDILNDIVAQGHTLIQASILDENRSTPLPLEVFEGVSFLKALQELEQEWQSLLAEPMEDHPSFHQERIQHLEQQVHRYERQIAGIETMITHFKQLTQRADNFISFTNRSPVVSNHFASILSKKRIQLILARLLHQMALIKLSEMKKGS